MENISTWNNYYSNSPEIQVKAVPGDIVINIGGILYLVQTTNDYNNVVAVRTHQSKLTTLQSFLMLREYLIGKGIQFIRVEGNKKRYFFLTKLKGLQGYNCIQDCSCKERNVFYIKLV